MWDTLGIDATTDMLDIRKAYAARLKQLDRAGSTADFERLRTAYQTAMRQAEGRPVDKAPVTVIPPPVPQNPIPAIAEEDRSLPLLLARIREQLGAGDFPAALASYDQGLARGILPLNHAPYLDQIMELATARLEPKTFMALMKRAGWDSAPSVGIFLTRPRAAAAARLDAEDWYADLVKQAQGSGLRLELRGTPFLRWPGTSLQHRSLKRNARLLLTDRPQFIRIHKTTVADLAGKLGMYQRHQAWLAVRMPEGAIRRTQWMLNFDTKWGSKVRRAYAVLLALLIASVIAEIWGPTPAGITFYLAFLFVYVLGGFNGARNLGKRLRAKLRAWRSGKR